MPKNSFPMGNADKGQYPSQNMKGDADHVRGNEMPQNTKQEVAKPQPSLGWQDKGRMASEGEGDAGTTWGKGAGK